MAGKGCRFPHLIGPLCSSCFVFDGAVPFLSGAFQPRSLGRVRGEPLFSTITRLMFTRVA